MFKEQREASIVKLKDIVSRLRARLHKEVCLFYL